MGSVPERLVNVGPYALLGEVGKGGMGVVLMARDTRDGRMVAIKLINSRVQHERTRVGLVREAATTASLRHPNIVTIYDVNQHRGNLYIVMEFLQGAPLDRLLRRNWPLSMRHRLRIVAELCEALGFAHQQEIVHRDVKPANTFVLKDGSVKVVDFGLAAFAQMMGSAPSLIGTVPYMSPEQVKGVKLDGRSDTWSAGVTLYELVSGKLPFVGDTIGETFTQILEKPVPELSDSIPLKDELGHLLRRALHKEREHRVYSAQEFAAQLRGLMSRADSGHWVPPKVEDQFSSKIEEGTLLSFALVPDERQIQTEVEVRAPVAQARVESRPAEGRIYQRLDLGFKSAAEGGVEFHTAKYPSLSFRRKMGGELTSWRMLGTIFCLTLLAQIRMRVNGDLSTFEKIPIRSVGGAALVIVLGPTVFVVATWLWDRFITYPRCRGCGRPLLRRSAWRRFVRSKTEVNLGYRDCVAALKYGFWEDAARLLSIHGNERFSKYAARIIDTPWRYNLEFYECGRCAQRVARLTSEEYASGGWYEQPAIVQALLGEERHKTNLLSKVANELLTIFRASQRLLDTTSVNSDTILGVARILAFCGVTVLLMFPFELPFNLAKQTKRLTEEQLADSAYYGFGGSVDFARAAKYYQMAAQKGDAASANKLGELLEEGRGVPRDLAAARKWYEVAADLKNAKAEYHLGHLYEHGIGVPVDVKEAERWYEKGASHGSKEAYFSLGRCYEQGIGVPKDLHRALLWYNRAGGAGLADAIEPARRIWIELQK